VAGDVLAAHRLVEVERQARPGRQSIRRHAPHAVHLERAIDEAEVEVAGAAGQLSGQANLVARGRRQRRGRRHHQRLAIAPLSLDGERRLDGDRRLGQRGSDLGLGDHRLVEAQLDRLSLIGALVGRGVGDDLEIGRSLVRSAARERAGQRERAERKGRDSERQRAPFRFDHQILLSVSSPVHHGPCQR
jgi:hypothetical protein